MNHEALQRKLAQLEHEIHVAESASAEGSSHLSAIALTLDDAIRVAANIRRRLAGTPTPDTPQAYHVSRRVAAAS